MLQIAMLTVLSDFSEETCIVHCPWEGVLPCMGYVGMCGPKGYGFSGVLVINRVLILAILVINRVWFLH